MNACNPPVFAGTIMKITQILYVSNRKAWRAWLKRHYKTEKEIWLVYYRRRTGRPRIAYNDAVEEGLCFGWIDSTVKTLDTERFVQKFSPRKPKSGYSQANQERLRRMIGQGMVMKDVLTGLGDISAEKFKIPSDILRAIEANERARKNFQGYSGSYQRIRIAFIDSARNRPEEFQKRLTHFLRMTERNRQFGFGIETYF
jgi:uncharacterized protein YdeI (YjbR/CyaY-like superfamily)